MSESLKLECDRFNTLKFPLWDEITRLSIISVMLEVFISSDKSSSDFSRNFSWRMSLDTLPFFSMIKGISKMIYYQTDIIHI